MRFSYIITELRFSNSVALLSPDSGYKFPLLTWKEETQDGPQIGGRLKGSRVDVDNKNQK